jgi:hypothetical protein
MILSENRYPLLRIMLQAPTGDIVFAELPRHGKKGLRRISPCGSEADMPLTWMSDGAGKKERSRRVLTLAAPSSPWREEPSGVPPLPCLRPYHAKISSTRTSVCDLANTAWLQLGTQASPMPGSLQRLGDAGFAPVCSTPPIHLSAAATPSLARASDLNLLFDISFLLIALSYAAYRKQKSREQMCFDTAAPDVSVHVTFTDQTQISSDV